MNRRSLALLGSCLALYVTTRAIGISQFELHNDEAIYIEVAQIISSDWEENKYWTLDGRMRSDYKYPLPYWLGSWIIQQSDAIPYNVRSLALFFGLLGTASLFVLAASLWNLKAALSTCVLVLFSEYFLYFDSIFLAEVFVYGFGGLFWLLVYENARRPRTWTTLAAGIVGSLLFTTKASAWLFAIWSLPLLFLGWRSSRPARGERPACNRDRRRWFSCQGIVYVLAILGHHAIMPRELNQVREYLVRTDVIRSADELMEFPWRDWLSNLEFYGTIWQTEWGLPGIGMLFLVPVAGWLLWKGKRASVENYLVLALMAVASLAPAILLSKVQYVRHFGMGFYAVYLLLGVAIAVGLECIPDRMKRSGKVFLCVGLAILVAWKVNASYQPLIRWKQTPLAIEETPWDWAKGIGIFSLIDFLKTLPSGELIIPPNWGHPSTAVEIFKSEYPQLELRRPPAVSVPGLLAYARQVAPERLYFVYDPRENRELSRQISRHCVTRKIIAKKFRDVTFEDSRLIVCEMAVD